MRILVTGGAGYIGSTLTSLLLQQGHAVRAADSLLFGGSSLLGVWSHPEFQFARIDIRDSEAVRECLEDIEAVVHLAAIVGDPAGKRDPEVTRQVNLDASLSLLESSRRAGVGRFVFASTCSNYGKMSDSTQFIDENAELRPVSLYAETKVRFEQALLDSERTHGLCATPLRFATVFGVSPRMRFDLTVNEFTRDMLRKRHLVVFGEQFWRPYIHVRDVARAIALVLQSAPELVGNRVFNVGSTEQNYRKQDLVEMVQLHAPDAVVEYVHKEEDPRDYRVSFARVEGELGYTTTRGVEEGIREVAELVRSDALEDFEHPRYTN